MLNTCVCMLSGDCFCEVWIYDITHGNCESDYFIFQLDFAIERGGGLVILESKAGCRIYPARGFEEYSFLGPVLFQRGRALNTFFRERVVQRI